MEPLDKIRKITQQLTNYRALLEALQEMEMIYDNIGDWVDIYKPHHIDMELSETIRDVESKIQEIEDKLERL